jgi:cytochrome c biogenesis protein CcmG/thiol:disulfide interchange protein DsbE
MVRLLPLILFLGLLGLLGFGIAWNSTHDQREVPSPLIGKPAPPYTLPLLYEAEKSLSSEAMRGKPYLLNVFGSWCPACVDEHPVWVQASKTLGAPLVGYNWKDQPEDAKAWLTQFGNPYSTIVADNVGRTAIDFGVYGAPETFLIDAEGVVRLKHIGPVTAEFIELELRPAIAALGKAAK